MPGKNDEWCPTLGFLSHLLQHTLMFRTQLSMGGFMFSSLAWLVKGPVCFLKPLLDFLQVNKTFKMQFS